MSRDPRALDIVWVKVTDEVSGTDFTHWFDQELQGWRDIQYIPKGTGLGEQLVQKDERYDATLTRRQVEELLQLWRDVRSKHSGRIHSQEWIEYPTNAYLILWSTPSGIPARKFIYQGEHDDEWELGILLDALDLKIVVEGTPFDPGPLTPSQQAAAADQGGMFHPSIPVGNPRSPHAVFYDVAEDAGIEVSAGWSPVDARKGEATKLVMIDIEEGAGRVRIELNDTVIHDGTF